MTSTVGLHHQLSSILSDASAELPELRVIRGCHELGLHSELRVSVDNGAAWGICICRVLFSTLSKHIVLTLAKGVTVAISAGMGFKLEAILIGLHDVDAGAFRRFSCSLLARIELRRSLRVARVVHFDCIEACDAATVISS